MAGIREESQRSLHQFSGAVRNREWLSYIALCCNPELLIADDEPTTALDVTPGPGAGYDPPEKMNYRLDDTDASTTGLVVEN